LAIGFIVAIGTATSRAEMSIAYYYSAPGNYATTSDHGRD
jgi:hypothetical protein